MIFSRFTPVHTGSNKPVLTYRHLSESGNYLLESKLLDAKVKLNDKNSRSGSVKNLFLTFSNFTTASYNL